jgi:hypothetical protein
LMVVLVMLQTDFRYLSTASSNKLRFLKGYSCSAEVDSPVETALDTNGPRPSLCCNTNQRWISGGIQWHLSSNFIRLLLRRRRIGFAFYLHRCGGSYLTFICHANLVTLQLLRTFLIFG